MATMDAATFQHATGVSRETTDRLSAFVDLLHRWQPRINLVANSTLHDVWERHLLDSAQLAGHLPEASHGPGGPDRPDRLDRPDQQVVLADFGAGAGLPGLVLALLRPDLDVHLVEVDARKCSFLLEASRVTGAEVAVHRARIETASLPPVTIATARALAPLDKALGQVAPHLDSHAICLFHKGQKWADELAVAERRWKMQVDALHSVTDPAARILRITGLAPKNPMAQPGPAAPAAGSQEQR